MGKKGKNMQKHISVTVPGDYLPLIAEDFENEDFPVFVSFKSGMKGVSYCCNDMEHIKDVAIIDIIHTGQISAIHKTEDGTFVEMSKYGKIEFPQDMKPEWKDGHFLTKDEIRGFADEADSIRKRQCS